MISRAERLYMYMILLNGQKHFQASNKFDLHFKESKFKILFYIFHISSNMIIKQYQ